MNLAELDEALEGHQVLSVEYAQTICQWLAIPFDEQLVISWNSKQQAWREYGFVAVKETGSCVFGLDLSYYVCAKLGIDPAPGAHFTGKGFQTQANFSAIKKKLEERGVPDDGQGVPEHGTTGSATE